VEQIEFLHLAAKELEKQGIPWMLVGSYATSAWGEARFTQDIDIVVDLNPDQVSSLCAAFPQDEYYVSEVAAHDAVRMRKQFNVIHPASGNKIDFMVAGRDEWSRKQLERCVSEELQPGIKVRISSPEDVMISKMRYYKEGGSDKHLRDCAGVLVVQGDRIDRSYIVHWAEHFGLMEIWNAILKRVNEVYGSEH
jgi:hypothetical protein